MYVKKNWAFTQFCHCELVRSTGKWDLEKIKLRNLMSILH